MRTPILRAAACLMTAVCLHLSAPAAQEIPPGNDANPIADALKLRTTAEQAVRQGTQSADEALVWLKAQGSITGLDLDPDADFAYGVLDVGQRLLIAAMPEAAEVFFKASEQTLAPLVQRTPDKDATLKAQYLRKLSFLRGNYLGQFAQAMKDIDQAIALDPKDRDLQRQKQILANSTGALGKTKQGN